MAAFRPEVTLKVHCDPAKASGIQCFCSCVPVREDPPIWDLPPSPRSPFLHVRSPLLHHGGEFVRDLRKLCRRLTLSARSSSGSKEKERRPPSAPCRHRACRRKSFRPPPASTCRAGRQVVGRRTSRLRCGATAHPERRVARRIHPTCGRPAVPRRSLSRWSAAGPDGCPPRAPLCRAESRPARPARGSRGPVIDENRKRYSVPAAVRAACGSTSPTRSSNAEIIAA
jgi:hypothetical protein